MPVTSVRTSAATTPFTENRTEAPLTGLPVLVTTEVVQTVSFGRGCGLSVVTVTFDGSDTDVPPRITVWVPDCSASCVSGNVPLESRKQLCHGAVMLALVRPGNWAKPASVSVGVEPLHDVDAVSVGNSELSQP